MRMKSAGASWHDIGLELQRLPPACRVCWYHRTAGGPRRAAWTPEEDSKLRHLREELKLEYRAIQLQLPRRTLAAILNRYEAIRPRAGGKQ